MALFLCLALGFAVGKVRVWKISLGGVAGTLVVAILVGMLGDIKLNDEVKTIAFALFIFTLGYISGPTFVGSLNRQSLKYAAFTVIEIASVLGITAVAILIMRLDIGTAAGLLAGGATESAVVGTATDAIARLPLSDAEIETLQANVGTAYSISYICGLITIVLLSSQIFPLIMRVSLRDEAAKLWKKLGGGADEDSATPQRRASSAVSTGSRRQPARRSRASRTGSATRRPSSASPGRAGRWTSTPTSNSPKATKFSSSACATTSCSCGTASARRWQATTSRWTSTSQRWSSPRRSTGPRRWASSSARSA